MCAQGEVNFCLHKSDYPYLGVGGGFGDRYITHETGIELCPPELTLDQAVLVEPIGIGTHAVLRHPPKPGDKVLVIGAGMTYDACNKVGLIARANTDFPEGGATWYLRGDLAVDNAENRVYASGATITSCDLPDPHYHFAARDVKWVSKTIMVSRPAVLYVADVPILWLPFIFQDLRKGRRSGLIPPQFGVNDIVRNSRSYQRHISNLGYYWAIGDYADAQSFLDALVEPAARIAERLANPETARTALRAIPLLCGLVQVEIAYRAAGLLPAGADQDDTTAEVLYLFNSIQGPHRKATAIRLLKALVLEEENEGRSEVQGRE